MRLQPAQLGPGLEAELLDQVPAAVAHDLERVGLAAGAVEREHQRPAQPLAQRVLGHERAQLADQVGGLPARQLGGEPLLDRLQPQLLQARDLALRELVEAVVGQRRPAPQRERRGSCRPPSARPAPLEQRLEAAAVDRLAVDLQRVARGAPADAAARSPSRARRRETCFCSAWSRPSGAASPQTASTSSSTDTASGARSASATKSRRCLAPSNST